MNCFDDYDARVVGDSSDSYKVGISIGQDNAQTVFLNGEILVERGGDVNSWYSWIVVRGLSGPRNYVRVKKSSLCVASQTWWWSERNRLCCVETRSAMYVFWVERVGGV